VPLNLGIGGCIQKFPDWPPGARTAAKVQLSATRCLATITLCVASRVFIVVSVYFVMTESGNFWIHPRKISYPYMVNV
jgi:hypothetical protein